MTESGRWRRHDSRLLALAADDAEQRLQVGEDVIHIQIDRERGGDVVRFAAIHHALHVEKP